MPALCEFLDKNEIFNELYLADNKIKSDGAVLIFRVLLKNIALKVLDLSWNLIGKGSEDIGIAFLQLFSKNECLVHVDFSFNSISIEATSRAALGLEKNFAIYGIHWSGNGGYVDADGFLVAYEA